MALDKQLVPLMLAKGIDTKTDPKLGTPEDFARVENAVYDEIGKLKKRNGYDEIQLVDIDNVAINSPKYLTRFLNELLLLTTDSLYAFSESLQRFILRGSVYGVFPSNDIIIKNAYEQTNLDSVVSNNIKIFAWNDSRGGVRASVYDRLSDTFVRSDFEISANGTKPKLAVLGNVVHVFYADSTDINYRKFDLFNPSTLSSELTLVNNLDSTNNSFDVEYSGTRAFIAYNSSVVGANLRAIGINADGTLTSALGFSSQSGSEFIDVYVDPVNRVVITYGNGTYVRVVIVAFTLTAALLSPTTIESVAAVNGTSESTSDSNYMIIYEVAGSSPDNNYIKKNTVTLAGSVGTASVLIRSLGLASHAVVYDGAAYFLAAHESTLQSTYFLLNTAGTVVAKLLPGNGGTLVTSGSLPKMQLISDGVLHVPVQVKGKLVSAEENFFTLLGVTSVELDFGVEERYQSAESGRNLLIAGGYVQNYDGAQVTEHGFHLFPEEISQASTATTGGSLTDGTRSYVAIYSWYDNQGLEHRSAESLVLTSTLSGGTSTQTCTVTVPTLRITDKPAVRLDLFRSEDAGTTLYKVTSVSSPVFNDKTVDTVNIVDIVSDSDLISREPLYTTGGILENTAPPSAQIVTNWKNRVALAGLEDENLIVYSKIRNQGDVVGFNDTLQILCKSDGGGINALAEMDEKLIVFKKSAMFFISGDGPTNAGEQDNFTEPEQISLEIGCIDRDSLALIPQGLMFKSNKGIYLLTRGLGLQYIGDKVEGFNTETITSSKIIPTNNQVRFTTADSDCLVYNYFLNKWCTFTNHKAKSTELVGDDYYVLRADDTLYKSNPNNFSDNGTPIKLLIETEWLSFAQLQGFTRVYKMLLLGEWKSVHTIRAKFAYDFINAWTNEVSVNPANYIDANTYGSQSPYGSGSPYGGTGSLHQLRIDLKRQKCQSIRIRIEDEQQSDTEGLNLTALTLEVGAKQGLNKMGSSRKFGAS